MKINKKEPGELGCVICGRKFRNKWNRDTHLKTQHADEIKNKFLDDPKENELMENQPVRSTTYCIICGDLFRDVIAYNQHLNDAHFDRLSQTLDPIKNSPEIVRPALSKVEGPTFVRAGKHFVALSDISMIRHAKDDLYIVKLFSDPNPQYPMWIRERDVEQLARLLNIAVSFED